MNTVATSEPHIAALQVTNDSIIAQLKDGRTISVPLAWSWRLSEATPQQRNKFEILGNGQGVHWDELDEDISAWGMLYGVPARRSRRVSHSHRPKTSASPRRVKMTT